MDNRSIYSISQLYDFKWTVRKSNRGKTLYLSAIDSTGTPTAWTENSRDALRVPSPLQAIDLELTVQAREV